MAFPPMGNSDHVVVSVFIDFKLGACASACEFCELVQVGIDVYISIKILSSALAFSMAA